MSKKMTTEEFIAKAREIHGDKYDYSKVKYVNSKTPVCIICPEHGEFWQKPNYHLSGYGCDKCGGTHKYTTEEFISRAREVHGDRYDYSKVEYVDAATKVCIICPEHSEFWQAPASHLYGRGCPKCSKPNLNITTKDFISKAREVHGDRYDYSKTEYVNSSTKVCIICPEHGEFCQKPNEHLMGHGCSKCSGNYKPTTEEFISRAREVHGDKYDYSKVEYKGNKTKVCIVCPEHGEFWITPNAHLSGQKCARCSMPNYNLTTEEFISKARKVHGNKYDYSKVVYVNNKTPVCIICPEHGEFWQKPDSHLNGRSCPSCIKNKKLNIEDFITKAREIHGDKYDYSKVEYVNSQTPVCIICPEHGEFWQKPSKHLRGQGCPKCGGSTKLTTENFIAKAREIHGDKYDYSKVEYVNSKTKVCIICPEHGEFWQVPGSHLQGVECPKCARPNSNMTTTEFIDKAKSVHGDKYNYSKVEYVNMVNKVCIVCPEHGEFWQYPVSHLSGRGCPKCIGRYKTTKDFINEAREVHGDKYDYSKVEYIGSKTPVCIICPKHGEFWQTPVSHLYGRGCPNCAGIRKEYKFNLLEEFKDEYSFRAFLENNSINILQVILRNIEPKYEPIKADLLRAIANRSDIDPIRSLEEKYKSNDDTDEEAPIEATTNISEHIDLDDTDAANKFVPQETKEEEQRELTIEDVVKNREQELKVINRIEHMLTPEDRKYIMDKFFNDRMREYMATL